MKRAPLLVCLIILCAIVGAQTNSQQSRRNDMLDILRGRTLESGPYVTVFRDGRIECVRCVGLKPYTLIGRVPQTFLSEIQRIDSALRNHHAQQTKPDAITLSPKASAGLIQAVNDIAAENARHEAVLESLNRVRQAYLDGAQVPDGAQCRADERQIVICTKPEAAKAQPSPR